MLSFFNRPDKPEVTDKMYMTGPGKYHGLLSLLATGQTLVLVYYFQDTWKDFQAVLDRIGKPYSEISGSSCREGSLNVIHADALREYPELLPVTEVFFLEHFPSYRRESELLKILYGRMHIRQVSFFISADDPLFTLFGGGNLAAIMQKMGVSGDEAVSHNMISKSIIRAQQKVDEHLRNEIRADHAGEWLRLNTPGLV